MKICQIVAGRVHKIYTPQEAEWYPKGVLDLRELSDEVQEGWIFNYATGECRENTEEDRVLSTEVLSRMIRNAERISSLNFVNLAQKGEFDNTTILENAASFGAWQSGMRCIRGTIIWDNGDLYRALDDIEDNGEESEQPSILPELWQRIGNPADEWPIWSQWLSVGDMYQIGDKCSSVDYSKQEDLTVYRWISTSANNVWRPGEYGWEKQL